MSSSEVKTLSEYCEDLFIGPQVTSTDPNERKMARRLRIQRRLKAIEKITGKDEESAVVTKTDDPIVQQLKQSLEVLQRSALDGDEFITNIRVANDGREVDRREDKDFAFKTRIGKLEAEADLAQEQFDKITEQWATIHDYNDPLRIHDEIGRQKEKCDLVIKQKDELIASLKNELQTAEKKYAEDQKKQNEDIAVLTKRIENEMIILNKVYEKELELIENVIESEQQLQVEANSRKWEDLYKKRDQEEDNNMVQKFKQIEEFDDKMTNMRKDFQEHYRATKISLENNIDQLQKEFERIKALALLNTEKLDYNYQILKKREDENIIIRSQQKRRINKLQDVINILRRKISKYESDSKEKITKFEEEIKKLNNNILEIEQKADHFAKVNDEKFDAMWKMNIDEAHDMLKKILTIDRILYEQQLGMDWVAPPMNILQKYNLPSYRRARKILSVDKKTDTSKLDQSSIITTNKEVTGNLTDSMTDAFRITVRNILKRISDKSGFLAEHKLRSLLKPYANHEKALIRIDQVFQALKVGDKDAIDFLIPYFLPFTHCPICINLKSDTDSPSEKTAATKLNLLSDPTTMVRDHESIVSSLTVGLDSLVFATIRQPVEIIDEALIEVMDESVTDSQSNYEKEDDFFKGECLGPDTASDSAFEKNWERVASRRQSQLAAHVEEAEYCRNYHPLTISSVYVIEALKQFVENYHVKEKYTETIEGRLRKVRNTVSRLLEERDMTMFWECYEKVFCRNRVEVWDALYGELQKYLTVLKQRKLLGEEVKELRMKHAYFKKAIGKFSSERNLSEES